MSGENPIETLQKKRQIEWEKMMEKKKKELQTIQDKLPRIAALLYNIKKGSMQQTEREIFCDEVAELLGISLTPPPYKQKLDSEWQMADCEEHFLE